MSVDFGGPRGEGSGKVEGRRETVTGEVLASIVRI